MQSGRASVTRGNEWVLDPRKGEPEPLMGGFLCGHGAAGAPPIASATAKGEAGIIR